MSSSFADAMAIAALLKDKDEGRRSSVPRSDFLTDLKRFQRWQDTMEETREKKEKEKKDKENKPEGRKMSYLEAIFWLFFLSPIIGPLWYNLEHALVKSIN